MLYYNHTYQPGPINVEILVCVHSPIRTFSNKFHLMRSHFPSTISPFATDRTDNIVIVETIYRFHFQTNHNQLGFLFRTDMKQKSFSTTNLVIAHKTIALKENTTKLLHWMKTLMNVLRTQKSEKKHKKMFPRGCVREHHTRTFSTEEMNLTILCSN